jgi:hypothetical protein
MAHMTAAQIAEEVFAEMRHFGGLEKSARARVGQSNGGSWHIYWWPNRPGNPIDMDGYGWDTQRQAENCFARVRQLAAAAPVTA